MPWPCGGRQPQPLSIVLAAFLMVMAPFSSSAAAAETDFHVALDYGVDASVRGCWDESEFRHKVAQGIGYDPFREDALLHVKVRVGGSADAVDGQVEWRKANGLLMGDRRFVAKDGNCAKLLREMTFAVGLQIELLRPKASAASQAAASPTGTSGSATTPGLPSETSASAAVSGAESTPEKAPSPPPATPVKATPKPDLAERASAEGRGDTGEVVEPSAPNPPPHWPMWVGLGPSLAWRMSPVVTADARLFLGMRNGRFSLEIGAEATYPSTERRWDGSGFRQTLLGGTLALCGHRDWLAACALGRASEVRVTGLGVTRPRSPNGFVAQAGVRVATTFPLGGRWFAAARVDGLGLLTPSRIVLNQATVWEMPRLGVLAGIDVSARFR